MSGIYEVPGPSNLPGTGWGTTGPSWAPAPERAPRSRHGGARIAAALLGAAAAIAAGVGIGHGLWPLSPGASPSLSAGGVSSGSNSANGGSSGSSSSGTSGSQSSAAAGDVV